MAAMLVVVLRAKASFLTEKRLILVVMIANLVVPSPWVDDTFSVQSSCVILHLKMTASLVDQTNFPNQRK